MKSTNQLQLKQHEQQIARKINMNDANIQINIPQ